MLPPGDAISLRRAAREAQEGTTAMPSPFPGMDPYLETPHLGPDVHHRLISQIQTFLNPGLRPRYVARVGISIYISDQDDPGREALFPRNDPVIPDVRVEKVKRRRGRKPQGSSTFVVTEPLTIPRLPDEEIKEARLEIRHLESGSLATVIEILSPTNKIAGSRGRTSFMEKRREVLGSEVHWVEIDLLRGGAPSVINPPIAPSDYRILVWRSTPGSKGSHWPVSIRQPLPVIGIPLRGKDPDLPLDLGAVLQTPYEHGAYDLSIDYAKPPDPPLDDEDAAWADQLLREKGLR